jgi:protein gp37
VGDKSAIEWTDATWTPIRARVKQMAEQIATEKGYTSLIKIARRGAMEKRVGPHCERVSPGCEHCYSETNNSRCLPNNGTGLPFDRRARELVDIFVDEKILAQPLHWRQPKKVFVCSQTDLFGEWVPDDVIDRVFAVMQHAVSRGHVFQVLTKRAGRMRDYFDDSTLYGRLLKRLDIVRAEWNKLPVIPLSDPHRFSLLNVWLGVSVEDQKRADERIPLLLQTPAAVRWISAEPLLGPVDLYRWLNILWQCSGCREYFSDSLPLDKKCPSCGRIGYWTGSHIFNGNPGRKHCQRGSGIDWVVAGGESGPGARPMHPDWLTSLRDQCTAAAVPFLFKQWGEWAPVGPVKARQAYVCESCGQSGDFIKENLEHHHAMTGHKDGFQNVYRVGKKAAGRMLDGREWNEYPEAVNVAR